MGKREIEFKLYKNDWNEIRKISKACSKDSGKLIINGVLIEKIDDKTLRFVATDGYRLFFHDAIIYSGSLDGFEPVIIHKNIFKFTCKGIICSFEIGENVASVQDDCSDGGMFANIITGNFPDYRRVIPSLIGQKQTDIGYIALNSRLLISNGEVRLKFYGESQPIEVYDSSDKLTGVIMPIRTSKDESND